MRRWRRLAVAFLVALFAAGAIFGRPEHPHVWLERIPGFYAFFALAGTALLVLGFRAFGERWLQRRESYYTGQSDE